MPESAQIQEGQQAVETQLAQLQEQIPQLEAGIGQLQAAVEGLEAAQNAVAQLEAAVPGKTECSGSGTGRPVTKQRRKSKTES